jgi:hypothetical protein
MTAPLGHTSLVVLPGHAVRKTWWRNLDPSADVGVLDEGSWRIARARLLRPGSLDFPVARSAYVARWPRVRVGAGPLVVLDLRLARVSGPQDQGPVGAGPAAVGASVNNYLT